KMSQSPYFAAPQKCSRHGTDASWMIAVTRGPSAVAPSPRSNLLRRPLPPDAPLAAPNTSIACADTWLSINWNSGEIFLRYVGTIGAVIMSGVPIIQDAAQ